MDDNIQRYLQWVTCEIQKYESYHNHKELMAWLVTAFYVTGIISFGIILANETWIRSIGTIGILLTGYLVWIFVNMQFNRRWESADIQKGLMRFAAHLCSGSVQLPKQPEFNRIDAFPDHIWKFIEEVQEDRTKKASALINLFRRPFSVHLDDRWKTELPSYGLIIIATVTAFTSLWVY